METLRCAAICRLYRRIMVLRRRDDTHSQVSGLCVRRLQSCCSFILAVLTRAAPEAEVDVVSPEARKEADLRARGLSEFYIACNGDLTRLGVPASFDDRPLGHHQETHRQRTLG